MAGPGFTVEPDSITVDEASIYAEVQRDETGDSWSVVVVIGRPPGADPIPGSSVDAMLVDKRGRPQQVLERPSGVLVEFGGGLGNSANARFRFRAEETDAAELLVTYGGRTVRFQVVAPRAGDQAPGGDGDAGDCSGSHG